MNNCQSRKEMLTKCLSLPPVKALYDYSALTYTPRETGKHHGSSRRSCPPAISTVRHSMCKQTKSSAFGADLLNENQCTALQLYDPRSAQVSTRSIQDSSQSTIKPSFIQPQQTMSFTGPSCTWNLSSPVQPHPRKLLFLRKQKREENFTTSNSKALVRQNESIRSVVPAKLVLQNRTDSTHVCKCTIGWWCLTFSVLLVMFMMYYMFVRSNNTWSLPIHSLEQTLQSQVVGQEIAIKKLINLLSDYLQSEEGTFSRPLSLLLVGGTGTGKSLISKVLASFFPVDSVHKVIVPLYLKIPPEFSQLSSYVERLAAGDRPHLFIVDDASHSLLKKVQEILDSWLLSGNSCSSFPVIFLCISNNQYSKLNEIVINHFQMSGQHNNIPEEYLFSNLEREVLGVSPSKPQIATHLIPLLPLQRHHVEHCIREELRHRGIIDNHSYIVSKLLEETEFFPPSMPVFAVTGCKRISRRVDLYLF
ncbi:torsin-2A-like isoform X2 [Tachypleus tridentatus]|uniref:torsin-2A-like isoform X2 n=1 Tax=Tachypleus tridentatus TaxID=6853 RepID=UPI003FCF210E